MNRTIAAKHSALNAVPRTRGDEPVRGDIRRHFGVLFPAHAGMNRVGLVMLATSITVPRTRGDEPFTFSENTIQEICSPHTRG